MQNTKNRKGVLVYIATTSKKIAIVGDVGINNKVSANFWDEIVKDLVLNFRTDKAKILAKNIISCGEQLSIFFPLEKGDFAVNNHKRIYSLLEKKSKEKVFRR